MPKIHGLHHVALWSKDFDRSVDYYTRVLGLQPRYQWGEAPKRAIIMQCGNDGHVEVFERPDHEDTPAEARLLHLALSTRDVDGLYQASLDAGCKSRVEPKDAQLANHVEGGPSHMKVRIAFVEGLDGEVIEFFEDKSDKPG